MAQQELEVQMVGWSDCEEKLTKAEAKLTALRLELARLDGEIPYGN